MPRRLIGHEPITAQHFSPHDSWCELFEELAEWFSDNERPDIVLYAYFDDDEDIVHVATVYESQGILK